jgi:hypothetical protein
MTEDEFKAALVICTFEHTLYEGKAKCPLIDYPHAHGRHNELAPYLFIYDEGERFYFPACKKHLSIYLETGWVQIEYKDLIRR